MILFEDVEPGAVHHDRRGRPAPARIKVVGVGGGGGNAVNRMIQAGIRGVDFIAANTDLQVLRVNKAPHEAPARPHDRRGAWAPGRTPRSARTPPSRTPSGSPQTLAGSDMVFVTAGMGGGTGTGRGARRRAARLRGGRPRRRHRLEALRLRRAAQAPLRRGRHRRAARVRRHAHHDPERAALRLRRAERDDLGGVPHRRRRPPAGRAGDQRPDHRARRREPRLRRRQDGHGEHGDGPHGDRHGDGRAPGRRGGAERHLEPAPRGAVDPGRARHPDQRHGRRRPDARRGERGVQRHPAGGGRGGEHHLRPRPGRRP